MLKLGTDIQHQCKFIGTNNSTSSTTGAVTIDGGLGVAKDIQLGGSLIFSNKGSVSKATSASTGVTLNTSAGKITTVNQAVAAHGTVTFTVTNSFCLSSSLILTSSTGTGNGSPLIETRDITNGSFKIKITNSASTGMTNQVKIAFIVL